MKRMLAFFLTMTLCLSLAACGSSAPKEPAAAEPAVTETVATTVPTEETVSSQTVPPQPTEKLDDNSDSSYESILDTYTQKMNDAVPGLIDAYRTETEGISDIQQKAKICNDKVGVLAKISNEGVEEMAKLMFAQGDSYDVYQEWAGKLMENYMDIASKIQNIYLDSAT